MEIFTVEIKNEFDKLLFDLGIIEMSKEKMEAKLNKKENRHAIKLLQNLGYVKCSRKNDNKNEYNKIFKIEKEYKWEKIELPLIKLFKDLGYKSKNEFTFVKKDKKILKNCFIQKE